jgi:large subunit ribosomal protein L29
MRTKARDLRQLTAKELGEKAASLEEELFNLRFQASMGQLSNPLRLRIVRKDAARVKTVLGEKIRSEKAAAAGGAVDTVPKAAAKIVAKDAPKDAAKAAPVETKEGATKDEPKAAAKAAPKKAAKAAAKKAPVKKAKKETKKAKK